MTNTRFDTSLARRFGVTRPVVVWGTHDCSGCEHNTGISGHKYGNHDEATCTKNGGHRTSAHDAVRDLLIEFHRQCHFQDIRWEVKNWDHTTDPNVKEGHRRVPDTICTDPTRPSTSSWFAPPGLYLHLATATMSTTHESWRRRQRISSAPTRLAGVTMRSTIRTSRTVRSSSRLG
jgi:hypothetical protein